MKSPEQLESISPVSREVDPNEVARHELMETRREAFLETFKSYSERKLVDAAYIGGAIKDRAERYAINPAIQSMKEKIDMLETASSADRMRYAAALTASLATYYLAAKRMPAETIKAEAIKYLFMLPEFAAWAGKIGPKAAQAIQEFCSEKKDLLLRAVSDAKIAFPEK